MAVFQITYDSKEKSVKATIDGKEVENFVNGCFTAYNGEGSCMMESSYKDDGDVYHYMRTSASDKNPEVQISKDDSQARADRIGKLLKR